MRHMRHRHEARAASTANEPKLDQQFCLGPEAGRVRRIAQRRAESASAAIVSIAAIIERHSV
jgi:hypothetical protein